MEYELEPSQSATTDPGAPPQAPDSPPQTSEPVSPEADPSQVASPEGASPEPGASSDDPGATSEPTTPETPEAPTAVDVSAWNSLDDVTIDSFPEVARPHLNEAISRIRDIASAQVQSQRDAADAEKLQYETARTRFDQLVETLEAAEGAEGQVKALSQEVQKRDTALDTVFKQNTGLVWRLFLHETPSFEQVPDQVRQVFGAQIQHPSFHTRFQDNDPVKNLTEAFRYACFQAGVDPTTFQASVTSPVGSTPATPADRSAARAAAITDGKNALNAPSVSVDDLTMDEIMDRNDHLLKDLFNR